MPLKQLHHNGHGSRDLEANPIFSREPIRVPRYAIPPGEMDADIAYQIVHDELNVARKAVAFGTLVNR